jgi:deoxyhypusine synthase
MLYFHSYKTERPLVIDIVKDIRRLNDMSVKSKRAGMIILGGGVCKHQIANAMLFVRPLPSLPLPSFPRLLIFFLDWSIRPHIRTQRNGADYAVYINTGQEYDGSDSGARTDEAVSWGKIKADARQIKVYADATLVFPLLVAQTFAREKWEAAAAARKWGGSLENAFRDDGRRARDESAHPLRRCLFLTSHMLYDTIWLYSPYESEREREG